MPFEEYKVESDLDEVENFLEKQLADDYLITRRKEDLDHIYIESRNRDCRGLINSDMALFKSLENDSGLNSLLEDSSYFQKNKEN